MYFLFVTKKEWHQQKVYMKFNRLNLTLPDLIMTHIRELLTTMLIKQLRVISLFIDGQTNRVLGPLKNLLMTNFRDTVFKSKNH